MLYSNKHQTAVFRIPKVCSFALSAALNPLGFVYHPDSKPDVWGAEALRSQSSVTRLTSCLPAVADYKKASFVRHPEDRLFSAWRYIFTKTRNIPEGRLAFGPFIRRVISGKDLHLGTLWHAGLSQTRLLYQDGKLQVDFLGRYEAIDEAFHAFCLWAGLIPVPLPRRNSSGPPVDYRTRYTPELRELVRDHFKDDYQNFDYE